MGASITERLSAINARLNAIANNAKKVDELQPQTILDPSSILHVSRGGNSQSLEVRKIIEAITSKTYDKLLSIGEITLSNNIVSVPANAQWIIQDVNYQKNVVTNITIPYCATGLQRKDVLVANTVNEIVLIKGTETSAIVVRPNIPINTVLVTELAVTDSTVNTQQPIIESEFLSKTNQFTKESGFLKFKQGVSLYFEGVANFLNQNNVFFTLLSSPWVISSAGSTKYPILVGKTTDNGKGDIQVQGNITASDATQPEQVVTLRQIKNGFISKSEQANQVLSFAGSGFMIPPTNFINIIPYPSLVLNGLYDINYYSGKEFTFLNAGVYSITLKHNYSPLSTNYFAFSFPNEQDFILQPKEAISFKMDMNGKLIFIGLLRERSGTFTPESFVGINYKLCYWTEVDKLMTITYNFDTNNNFSPNSVTSVGVYLPNGITIKDRNVYYGNVIGSGSLQASNVIVPISVIVGSQDSYINYSISPFPSNSNSKKGSFTIQFLKE